MRIIARDDRDLEVCVISGALRLPHGQTVRTRRVILRGMQGGKKVRGWSVRVRSDDEERFVLDRVTAEAGRRGKPIRFVDLGHVEVDATEMEPGPELVEAAARVGISGGAL